MGVQRSPIDDSAIDFMIVLVDEVLDSLASSPIDNCMEGIQFVLFRGSSEAEMEQQIRPLMGPTSKVTHRGWSPSDLPVSPN